MNSNSRKQGVLMVVLPLILLHLSPLSHADPPAAPTTRSGVKLNVTDKEVVLDNGILQMTIANPAGFVTGIRYGGLENILNPHNDVDDRGYWDSNWHTPGYSGTETWLGTKFNVITQNDKLVEISFTFEWDPATWKSTKSWRLPVSFDRRYIMLSGSSGFYSYAILNREKGWAAANIDQMRAVFKLEPQQFTYMAVSNDRQRIMPTVKDHDSGTPLQFKEAVVLKNPSNSELQGQIDDKYQYSCDDKDNKVHGWISIQQQIGFWIITPTNEYRTAGPVKQDLTSHAGPIALQMFHSAHYAGLDVSTAFTENEGWRKVLGPFFVYLNSAPKGQNYRTLWDDATKQMEKEVKSWPYDFPASKDFPKAGERGEVKGKLLVKDRSNGTVVPGASAWVGLALPGEAGSWQTETKGYQFWSEANPQGEFVISGVHEGVYNLYAFVPGFIGDFVHPKQITITPGSSTDVGELTYEPLRNGPTVWEIGTPDRTALEFFVPDPKPEYNNKILAESPNNRFRQYGLWERYSELYPKEDVIYKVGESDYHKDWFFAQVTRKAGAAYEPTTWQVVFPLDKVAAGNYTLRIALASATRCELQVRFNDPAMKFPQFATVSSLGTDNAIARHGIHGLYYLFNVGVPSEWLRPGTNTLYLRQSRHDTSFNSLMYDYLRLEAPSAAPPSA